MNTPEPIVFYIGWDVGGWNCDKNAKSRDAVVLLDSAFRIVGTPWRGNLRRSMGRAASTKAWIVSIFELCRAQVPSEPFQVTMAIDTPLGFPAAFQTLILKGDAVEPAAASGENVYLFRATERHLFRRGFKPLSAVKDMIGSQATKGIHALIKFARVVETCGVWTDGVMLWVIETYPSVCRDTSILKDRLACYPRLNPDDLQDALVCAVMAGLFETAPESLEAPDPAAIPVSEGWIWAPRPSTHASPTKAEQR